MKQSSKIWDRFAKGYAKRPISDQASYERKLQATQGYLRPDMELLEFGCGTGSTALIHAPHVKHILGIDFSAKMIEFAQAKVDAASVKNVTVKQSSIEELDQPEQSVDAVLGMSILHLLEEKEDTLNKVYRLLKPGGVFITSTVCIGDTMKFFKFILPIGYFLRLIPLVKVFTAKELEESLTQAGFAINHKWRPGKGKAIFIVAKKPA